LSHATPNVNGNLKEKRHRDPNVQKLCKWDHLVCDYKDKKVERAHKYKNTI